MRKKYFYFHLFIIILSYIYVLLFYDLLNIIQLKPSQRTIIIMEKEFNR